MLRRSLLIAAFAALAASQAGCRSQCSSRQGLFSSNGNSGTPCQTVGRGATGCFDAATGQPVPCPSGPPGNVIPGGTYPPPGAIIPGGPRPDELHMPSPTDMIRPPAIPYPAPGDALLPHPSSPGTPVKIGPNK